MNGQFYFQLVNGKSLFFTFSPETHYKRFYFVQHMFIALLLMEFNQQCLKKKLDGWHIKEGENARTLAGNRTLEKKTISDKAFE